MDEFSWDSFIRDCFQQKYILVVGNDVMLNEDSCGGNSDIYLWNKYLENSKKDRRLIYEDFLRKTKIPLDISNKNLLKLLGLKIFRVVITTTTDDLLERMMRGIWGDKLQVLNFCDEEKRNVFKSDANREFDLTTPTLCYAFGKVGHEKFAKEDDDKLEIIADWLNPTLEEYPEAFYRYIQTKKILAIGCKLDDWLFRFFWYSLRRNMLTLKSNRYANNSTVYRKGTVAIELDQEDKWDMQLRDYLDRNNLFYDGNAHSFIRDFLEKLTFDDNGFCIYKDIEMNNDSRECFISYAHEDFDVAYHLYLALKERGFSVWMDTEKMLPGSPYENRINKAIEQCEVFIPILSDTISNDFRNGVFDETDKTKRRYYLNEWEQVVVHDKKVIIPVLCKGFDVGDVAYKQMPWYKVQMDRTYYKIEDPLKLLIDGIRENGYDFKSSKSNE